MREPFWSDTFDGDLFKLVPGAEAILAPIAGRRLWTFCNSPTHGRLNHPCAWNTTLGLTGFFSTDPARRPAPDSYVTAAGLVECTVEEAVRDLFVHNLVMVVDGHLVARFDRWGPDMLAMLLASRRKEAEQEEARRQAYEERLRSIVVVLNGLVPMPTATPIGSVASPS